MTFTAVWTVLDPDAHSQGKRMVVASAEDVDALVAALDAPGATAAMIRHQTRPTVEGDEGEQLPDHDVTAGVWHGYEYMSFSDEGHDYATLDGDPASPPYAAHYDEFDPGTGVSIQALIEALREFLTTAQRPTAVAWRAD